MFVLFQYRYLTWGGDVSKVG